MVIVNCTTNDELTQNTGAAPLAPNWATQEFSAAQVWDRRCLKSLSRMADRLARSSGNSFSQACGHSLRQSAHRIFAHPTTSVMGMIAGHGEQTRQRCAEETAAGNRILVVQDTTDFDYSKHFAAEGLGPIGARNKRGLLSHCGLALRGDGLPLGVVHLDIWARDDAEHGKKQQRRQKPTEQKESYKWIEGLHGIEAAFDADQPVLVIADREADLYDYLAEPRHPKTHLLVRAHQPRQVLMTSSEKGATTSSEADQRTSLFDLVASSTVKGKYQLSIPRRPAVVGHAAQEGRLATLEVRFTEVELPAPASATLHAKTTTRLWVIQAREAEPQAEAQAKTQAEAQAEPKAQGADEETAAATGIQRVCWTLLCTEPILDADAAWQMVQFYALRWQVERLHFTLKSGLRAEKLQFDDGASLMKALALLYVVAWRLLWMLHISRQEPQTPSAAILEPAALAVLNAVSRRTLKTASEALLEIGKLGGHEHYRKGPPPGIKSLWLGLRRLDDIVIGFQLGANQVKN